jgi:hypothetical protein
MTAGKIVEVCNLYSDSLRDAVRHNLRLHHVQSHMVPLTIQFANDGRTGKAFRWLGFMQGVLSAEGFYSIDELKNHNRPDLEEG